MSSFKQTFPSLDGKEWFVLPERVLQADNGIIHIICGVPQQRE
jgi:hypothetical protein